MTEHLQLNLNVDQAEYDAWHRYWMSRVNNKDIYYVDVHDGILLFVTITMLLEKYPDKEQRIREVMGDAIDFAITDPHGGMVGGSTHLAKLLDLEPKEVIDTMMSIYKEDTK